MMMTSNMKLALFAIVTMVIAVFSIFYSYYNGAMEVETAIMLSLLLWVLCGLAIRYLRHDDLSKHPQHKEDDE